MTTATIHQIDRSDQPRSQRIARRLRGYLAEERIPAVRVANALGLTQSKFARRMTGATAFSIDELDQIAHVLGISFEWLTTGDAKTPPPNPGKGSNGGDEVRHQGLEPRTRWFEASAGQGRGNVLPLRQPVHHPERHVAMKAAS